MTLFTREQLETLLFEAVEDAHSDYLDGCEEPTYRDNAACWRATRDLVITDAISRLDGDAARPEEIQLC